MIGVKGMEGKFIYVFSVDDRNKMIAMGNMLIYADDTNSMYVFENTNKLTFSEHDIKYVVSDVLTF